MIALHYPPYIKLFAFMPAACGVTLGLLYLMHILIYVEDVYIDEDPGPKIAQVIMEAKKIATVREEPPQKVDEPMEQPAKPAPQEHVIPKIQLTGIPSHVVRTWDKGPVIGTIGGGQLLPYLRVQPRYPSRALTKGQEGFVELMFDVTEYGATTNVRVLYSEPSGVFDRASIKAVEKWKYKPRHVDGVPTRTYELKERIRFNIEQ